MHFYVVIIFLLQEDPTTRCNRLITYVYALLVLCTSTGYELLPAWAVSVTRNKYVLQGEYV